MNYLTNLHSITDETPFLFNYSTKAFNLIEVE